MTKIAIQDLERGKFTSDSNINESIVRTTVLSGSVGDDASKIERDDRRQIAILTNLERIVKLLENLNEKMDEGLS